MIQLSDIALKIRHMAFEVIKIDCDFSYSTIFIHIFRLKVWFHCSQIMIWFNTRVYVSAVVIFTCNIVKDYNISVDSFYYIKYLYWWLLTTMTLHRRSFLMQRLPCDAEQDISILLPYVTLWFYCSNKAIFPGNVLNITQGSSKSRLCTINMIEYHHWVQCLS